jgi:hypothetical protein
MTWAATSRALQWLLLATVVVGGCRKSFRADPVSANDRAAIADFVATLKHDPVALLVIRPDRLEAGAPALMKQLAAMSEPEQRRLEDGVQAIVKRSNPQGLQRFAALFADDWPPRLAGWDAARPILAALCGTGRDEDLSLLFRAFLAQPGPISPRALHHTISIPATDSRALSGALADRLAKHDFARLPDDPTGSIFFAIGNGEWDFDSGFVSVRAEPRAVRVEIVSEEFPAVREKRRLAEDRAALLTHPPDVAATIDPFPELAGSGADAVVLAFRMRNVFRWQFQHWLGAIAQIWLLPDRAEKASVIARGNAELLGLYPWLPRSETDGGADLTLGLDLGDGPGVRIAMNAAGTDAHRVDLPLASVLDEAWYRAAAESVGIDHAPNGALHDALAGWHVLGAVAVLANAPDRALPALAASPPSSSSGRLPVRWTAALRPESTPTPAAMCMARAARAMAVPFEALAGVDPAPRGPAVWLMPDLDPALACAAADEQYAAQAQSIRLARALVQAQVVAAEHPSARKISMGFYVQISGDEAIKEALLAKLESLPCFEEADLHSTEIFETSKERGGACHAFRAFHRSPTGRYAFAYLLRVGLKESIRGRRSFTLRAYSLRGKRVEPDFDAGTFSFPDARFVKEAANQIAIRTFMLPPRESRGHRDEPNPLEDPLP